MRVLGISVVVCATLLGAVYAEDSFVTLETTQARVLVAKKGARIVSYLNKGEELLWNANPVQLEASDWAHGGIPICWPWFGRKVGAPIHGWAWKRPFSVVSQTTTPNRAEAVLRLLENDVVLDYTLTLTSSLRLALMVRNTSASNFTFTVAFHPYFRVADRDQVSLTGVDGLLFKRAGKVEVWQGDFPFTNAWDNGFSGIAPRQCYALEGRQGKLRDTKLSFVAENFTGINLWNPGANPTQAACPGLMPGDAWHDFVSVEPMRHGAKDAVKLAPGGVWTGALTIMP